MSQQLNLPSGIQGVVVDVVFPDKLPEIYSAVEIQVDAFGDWGKSTEWMWASREFAENPIGEFFDPDQVVAAREKGLSKDEIHANARAGDYRPEKVPEDVLLPEVY